MQIQNQRKDAVEHRQRILQTAHSLFRQYGVEQVSMHQIAKSAGVGQGTLYRRYSNKGDLCFDLMNDSFQQFKLEITNYMEEGKALPIQDRMRYIIRKCIDFIEEKARMLGAMRTSNCGDGRPRFYHSPPYLFIHSVFITLLQERSAVKEINELDANFTAHAIMASMNPDLFIELHIHQGQSSEQIKHHLEALFVDTLFA